VLLLREPGRSPRLLGPAGDRVADRRNIVACPSDRAAGRKDRAGTRQHQHHQEQAGQTLLLPHRNLQKPLVETDWANGANLKKFPRRCGDDRALRGGQDDRHHRCRQHLPAGWNGFGRKMISGTNRRGELAMQSHASSANQSVERCLAWCSISASRSGQPSVGSGVAPQSWDCRARTTQRGDRIVVSPRVHPCRRGRSGDPRSGLRIAAGTQSDAAARGQRG